MADLLAQLGEDPTQLRVAGFSLRVEERGMFGPEGQLGLMLSGYSERGPAGPVDYLSALLLAPEQREATYRLVDHVGLLVCKELRSSHPGYRSVRGRSSRGRLSQGEYYHHDGCSGPTKPRVVEIRFPYQEVPRQVATAVAPFRASVEAMLSAAEGVLEGPADDELGTWRGRWRAGEAPPDERLDRIQGLIVRALRRELDAESARAYFRAVDDLAGAFRRPWVMGESRLIANAHPRWGPRGTMQHRRAYLTAHAPGDANGSLVKRWPAEELGE